MVPLSRLGPITPRVSTVCNRAEYCTPPRPVRPDQRHDFYGPHVAADVVDGDQAAETPLHGFHAQQHLAGLWLPAPRQGLGRRRDALPHGGKQPGQVGHYPIAGTLKEQRRKGTICNRPEMPGKMSGNQSCTAFFSNVTTTAPITAPNNEPAPPKPTGPSVIGGICEMPLKLPNPSMLPNRKEMDRPHAMVPSDRNGPLASAWARRARAPPAPWSRALAAVPAMTTRRSGS